MPFDAGACRQPPGGMASPRKPPKRIGGAPFASPRPHKDPHGFTTGWEHGAQPQAPPEQQRRRPAALPEGSPIAGGPAQLQRQARGAATTELPGGSSGRCRSDDRKSIASTPYSERAVEYVKGLAGQAKGAETARGAREWTLVQELDQVDHLARERARRAQDKQRRLENVGVLRAQMEVQEKAKDECRELWRKWRDHLEDDVERWKKEEQQKKAMALEVRRSFEEEQKRQREDQLQHRKAAYEVEQREGREMLAAVREAKRREDERESRRRQTERAAATVLAEEAKAARERKTQQQKEEAENDKVMSQKQQELLDRQDHQREEERNERLARMAKLLAQYEAGVGNELERKQREDEERAKKQEKHAAEKERRIQEERDRKLRVLKEAGKVAVAQQLEDHARQRAQLREEESQFAAQLKHTRDEAELREQASEQRRRQAREANAEELRKQMRERSELEPAQVQRDRMNEVERLLNRERLERAKDPDRPDGLQLLVNKKRMEYQLASAAR